MLSIYDRGRLGQLPRFETWDWRPGLTFTVLPIEQPPPNVGGIYALARRAPAGLLSPVWSVFYIGKTCSFGDRICESHHKVPTARAFGATHVHLLRVDDPQLRSDIEHRLVMDLRPPLNEATPPQGLGMLGSWLGR